MVWYVGGAGSEAGPRGRLVRRRAATVGILLLGNRGQPCCLSSRSTATISVRFSRRSTECGGAEGLACGAWLAWPPPPPLAERRNGAALLTNPACPPSRPERYGVPRHCAHCDSTATNKFRAFLGNLPWSEAPWRVIPFDLEGAVQLFPQLPSLRLAPSANRSSVLPSPSIYYYFFPSARTATKRSSKPLRASFSFPFPPLLLHLLLQFSFFSPSSLRQYAARLRGIIPLISAFVTLSRSRYQRASCLSPVFQATDPTAHPLNLTASCTL